MYSASRLYIILLYIVSVFHLYSLNPKVTGSDLMAHQFFKIISLFLVLAALSQNSWGACSILDSSGQPAARTADALGVLLSSSPACPQEVFAFRQLLKKSGLKLETTLVANRGFHNPAQGSFSMFEIVSGPGVNKGDFFFGHFTALSDDGLLIADQNPEKNSLMIEAFAWDPEKQIFNFYELRGDGSRGQWFYRGDSIDIVDDNKLLHRQPDPEHPQFGNRLRCSACHDAGGPIMKELYQPHNDWWEPKRKLDFGGRQADAALREILETLVPADQLAKSVVIGLKKLNTSEKFNREKSGHSLQEQLRPLFCPMELNFKSDNVPNEESKASIAIPAEFFVDSRLLDSREKALNVSRNMYEAALDAVGSHFPETSLKDGDHAWLTPVKAESDKLAIADLIAHGVIDRKFMADVLAIDMTNPVISQTRCSLLGFLPQSISPDWRDIFIKNLSQSQNAAAKQLASNLADPSRTLAFYQQQSFKFLKQCKIKLGNSKNLENMYRLLSQRRAEVLASEISKNPRGQILEPGFRVIFPENKIAPVPGKLKLDEDCDVVE